MKKLHLLFILCRLNFAGSAQVSSNYTFSSSSNTYSTTLVGQTTLFPAGWSSQVANVSLPFVFYFNGKGYSSVWVSSNGYITFGATAPIASTNNPIANNNGFDGCVSAFGQLNPGVSSGLVDAQNVAGNVVVTGTQTSGSNTVFVIQWSNCWRYAIRPNGGTDAIKFQIRLVQNTNLVEIMYGLCQTNLTFTFANLFSPVVGLGGSSSADYNNRSSATSGTWTTGSTIAGTSSSAYVLFSPVTTTVIPSGLTMDWTPTSSPAAFSGTPPVTTAIANTGITCGNVSLSLGGLPFNTGFTYQWQKSATGLSGSFTNCTGAGNTNASYIDAPTAATYYQCLVTGGSGTTASTSIAVGRESACPTAPTYTQSQWYNTDWNGFGLTIASFSLPSGVNTCGTSLSDLSASSSGTTQGYTTGVCTNYIDLTYLPPIKLQAGTSYPGGTITAGYTNAMSALVWIDFNDNGLFTDAGEQVTASITGIINTSSGNVTITIPAVGAGAYYGLHRMRVRAAFAAVVSPTANMATYGIAKDYMVSIQPPNQTIAASPVSPLCLPVSQEVFTSTVNISTGTPAVSTYTYTWSGPTAFTTTAISSSNTMSFTPTSTAYSGVYTVTTTADGAQACAISTLNLVVATTVSAPTAAPTGLSISGVNYTGASNITFTPNATVPDGYLIVATNSGTAPTAPVDATTYATGTTGAFGANSVVISGSVYGSAPSYNTNLLNSNSQYYIYVYPFNIDCSGPKYYTAAPALSGNTLTTCIAPPTILTASTPTGSTINLSWTAAVNGGNATAFANPASFTYTVHAYLDAGLSVEASGFPISTASTSYLATGLGVGTAYYFVVVSAAPAAPCGTSSNTATNTTTCAGTAIIPYIQKFETGSTVANLSPNCWTGNAGQYATAPVTGGEYKNGGTFGSPFPTHSGLWYYLFMGNNYISSATYANQWLESPGFSLSPGTYNFSFWYISNSQWSTIKAEYTTTAGIPSNATADMTGFTLIGTPPTNFNAGAWTKYSGTVIISAAGTYYFGIDAVMGASPVNLQMAIEDIEICQMPNVSASNTGPYCSPATVSLSSAGTTGALTYAWSGPSSYSSTLANATATGVTTGIYTYTLTGVSDPILAGFGGSCSVAAVTSVTVNVLPTVVAPATSPIPVCVGNTITLTGNVTGGQGLSYAWSGATTGIASASSVNTTIPSAVAANAGTYSLTVTAAGCSGSITGNSSASPQVVNVLPTLVSPASSPNPACLGGTINLTGNVTGGSGLTYAWTGPTTGITSASAVNTTIPLATTSNQGTYTLTVTAAGCAGSVIGNTSASPQVVNSLPTSVIPAVTPNPVCFGNSISLTGNVTGGQGLSYFWNGPTTGITSATVVNATIPSAVLANAGTYTLTVTAAGCVSSVSGNTNATPLVVNTLPTSVAPATSPIPVCVGNTITLNGNVTGGTGLSYSWTGPTTGIASASSVNTSIPSAVMANAGTYTLTVSAAGCASTVSGNTSASPQVVNVLPASVAPASSPIPVCVGNTITLNGNVTGGNGLSYAWTGPTAGITSASSVNTTIPSAVLANAGTYSLTVTAAGCAGNVMGNTSASPQVVNVLPASVAPTALPNPVCVGSTITLNGNVTGGNGLSYIWTGPTTGIASASSVNTTIPSAVTANAGTYTLTVTAAGCAGNRVGASASLVVNSQPSSVAPATAPNPICVGFPITLTGNVTGGTSLTYLWSGPVTGIVSASSVNTTIPSAVLANAGTYTLTVTAAGCAPVSGNTSASQQVVNALPVIHTFTGGGGYCSGDPGVPIGLTLSDLGISYQLYLSPSTAVGLPVSGTGAAISFGIYNTPGYYYAIATNTVTACTSLLSGVTVSINPLPDTFRVNGGGSYCTGGTGVVVGLNGSVSGISYQLYSGVSPVGSPVAGTGSAISFGLHTAGVYTAVATNNITLCVNNMPGSATVTAIPLPTVYTVTGGGGYCFGGTGVVIGLSGSDVGVTYQLYRGGTTIGTAVNGTGASISFGLQTVAGTYTVNAHNTATTCNNNMAGSVIVTVNPLPTQFNVIENRGGNYCVGDTGIHIGLSGSQTGKSYRLYLAGTGVVGSPRLGTGSAIDFGLFTTVGTYTVLARDTTTGCINNMLDSAIVRLNPVVIPTVSLSTNVGLGNAVCLGAVDTFKATITNGGLTPTFAWKVNGVNVGVPGTRDSIYYIPTNGDVVKVVLTSSAICAIPDTVTGTMIVNVDTPAPPSVFIDVSPITSINPGTSDTLRAIPTNGGPAPLFQWYKNGTIIPGATNTVYISNTFVNHDSVCCRMISSGGCGGVPTFNCVIISVYPAGITQVTNAGNIKLIPNPNKGEFMIRGTLGSQADEEVSVEITNMIGQVIYTNKIMAQNGVVNERIQLSSTLANGMYLLNLKSVNSNNVFRFVIEQ